MFILLPAKTAGEGKTLLLSIAASINDNRYSNQSQGVQVTLPSDQEIDNVLSKEPPLDIDSRKDHTTLAQEYTRNNGGRKGFCVRVYKEGKEILGSPFSSYGKAHSVLGLRANSRTVARYIDTGKRYKCIYTFTSC